MTNYTIEGTITAITCNDKTLELKLVGLEGYAIKLGDKKYNVLCEKDFPNDSNKTSAKAKIISQDIQFQIAETMKSIVTSSSLGKHAKVTVECGDEELKEDTPVLITSITIFAD